MSGITIKKSKLLLVEGSHEKSFFKKLLEYLNLAEIQVEPIGGKYKFRPTLKLVPTYDGFDSVESIGIVRDADQDFSSTFQSIQDALRDSGLPIPSSPLIAEGTSPRVTVFIAPDNQNGGDLEIICMATVQEEPSINCVDEYFECLEGIHNETHPKSSKARVQVFLASKPEGDIHMGIAAEKGYWNWDSPSLDILKAFLHTL